MDPNSTSHTKPRSRVLTVLALLAVTIVGAGIGFGTNMLVMTSAGDATEAGKSVGTELVGNQISRELRKAHLAGSRAGSADAKKAFPPVRKVKTVKTSKVMTGRLATPSEDAAMLSAGPDHSSTPNACHEATVASDGAYARMNWQGCTLSGVALQPSLVLYEATGGGGWRSLGENSDPQMGCLLPLQYRPALGFESSINPYC